MNIETIPQRPWCQLDDAAMGPATGVPSMLNAEETRFYFWLARHLAQAEGHIVDLGSFAGGSTAYLAEGNRQGGGVAQVFAFDQFRATSKVKARHLYAKGIAAFEGEDILPLSQDLLAPWSPRIDFCKGRIEEGGWSEGAISLLVLDASKTTATMDRMAEIFFPHLIPGVSVIVQQDELHWKEPWIAVQMQQLRAYFTPLCHVPGGAVAYLCTQKISPDMVRSARVDGLDDKEMIRALSRSRARLRPFGVGKKLKRQIEGLRLNPGQRKSWRFTNYAPAA